MKRKAEKRRQTQERDGTPFEVKRVQDLVRSNANATAIALRVTPPSLRHGCATHLLQGGAGISHVRRLLGHSHVQTTAIYTRVGPTDLAWILSGAHPREKTYNQRRKRASCFFLERWNEYFAR